MPYPIPWIPNISFIRWALEGYYLSEVNRYEDIYNVKPGIGSYDRDKSNFVALFGYHSDHYSLDIAMVFVIGIVIRGLALVLLHWMHKDKKR